MITQIFYSLVLFPTISYDQDFYGARLLDIREKETGKLQLFFQREGHLEVVDFSYRGSERGEEGISDIKNWHISSPYILLVQQIRDALWEADRDRDFLFFEEPEWYRKHAFGVVLTITSKCNIFCYYCFNDTDYELSTRNTRKNHTFEYWKKIIDDLYIHGTRVVILTGGEPMVAPFFWELLEYLRLKNIFVHINTNGTLLTDENIKRLTENFALNIMVSMHEFNDQDYYEVNRKGLEWTFGIEKVPDRFHTLFSDKVKQLRKLSFSKNISLEFLTILVWKNILQLQKIYEFGVQCGIGFHNWQFFRLYATKNNPGATSAMMQLAIKQLTRLNKKYDTNYQIVDPVPFCVSTDPYAASKVIDGVLSDTHTVKTIITTDGYVQMMSAYDNNFWNLADTTMDEIFRSEFVQKQLGNGFLPKACAGCLYTESCRGGSRMDANIIFGDYSELDPIANISNKKTHPSYGHSNHAHL